MVNPPLQLVVGSFFFIRNATFIGDVRFQGGGLLSNIPEPFLSSAGTFRALYSINTSNAGI